MTDTKKNIVVSALGGVTDLLLKRALLAEVNEDSNRSIWQIKFLKTTHPVKFYDVIEPLINQKVPVPETVAEHIKKEKVSTKISANTNELKAFLLR